MKDRRVDEKEKGKRRRESEGNQGDTEKSLSDEACRSLNVTISWKGRFNQQRKYFALNSPRRRRRSSPEPRGVRRSQEESGGVRRTEEETYQSTRRFRSWARQRAPEWHTRFDW